ncbi:hypothetical protein [Teichococcus aestuarii]|uniref:hypothetical protein n=1 Tax=Teichococcus aestuarii TaxID=568898 RepID=UPI00361CE4B0
MPALAPPLRAQPQPGAAALAPASPVPASLAPDSATLLLPGPEGGAAAQWARGVAAGLARGLPHAVALRTVTLGGPDGVTAANRFATLEAGDGRTLLVLPGRPRMPGWWGKAAPSSSLRAGCRSASPGRGRCWPGGASSRPPPRGRCGWRCRAPTRRKRPPCWRWTCSGCPPSRCSASPAARRPLPWLRAWPMPW